MNIDLMNAIEKAIDDGNGVKRDEPFIRQGHVVEDKVGETVTISFDRYNELLDHEAWVNALEACGIDCWVGYDDARELLNEWNEEK